MNKYKEYYYEFIKDLKYIDELINSLTIEQRKSLGATTYSIQGILGRYINEEKDFVKELIDKETPMKTIDEINKQLTELRDNGVPRSEVSDGYHTFRELYFHRMILFSIICNQNEELAWKSKLHDDGSMFEGNFIVGITTKEGQYTYHYHMDHWDMYDVKELEHAPKYDDHMPKDITRLLSIL